jgi:hypothetical protein
LNIVSLAFFRHAASNYESERCGEARGIFFVNFLRALVRAHHFCWGGWQLRIHHDGLAMQFPYFRALQVMEARGLLRLVDCGPAETLCGSMLWRMKPLWEDETDYLACRDVDSLPMPRDRRMVEEFVRSGKTAHAILDSESHSGPYMGGMTAWHAPSVRREMPGVESLGMMLLAARGRGIQFDLDVHGADQKVLNGMLAPTLVRNTLVHQRRQDLLYECETRMCAPQIHELDKVVRHIGAGYDVEKAMGVLAGLEYPEKGMIEACEREVA